MNDKKKHIEVCFSPALYPFYKKNDAIVVVIDILRATSAICVAFKHGVEAILPLASKEETLLYRQKGYLIAGERDGEKLPDFDFGNSPFHFMSNEIKGKKIAMTTTNGTQAIESAKSTAQEILIGSFLNFEILANYLIEKNSNILLLCSGWKMKMNLEDIVFAGALSSKLLETKIFETASDAVFIAKHLNNVAVKDMVMLLRKSAHRERLKALNLKNDIKYCFSLNLTNVIPYVSTDGHIYSKKF